MEMNKEQKDLVCVGVGIGVGVVAVGVAATKVSIMTVAVIGIGACGFIAGLCGYEASKMGMDYMGKEKANV